VFAALTVVLAAVAVVVAVNHRYSGYSVRVMLADAGGLETGSNVNINGVTVGSVASLGITKHDQAVAVLHLNKAAAPLGAGAHAIVDIDGFFGERLVDLTRGNYKADPEPSGFTIPVADSGVSARLDDVVDALDMDAQGALQTFLDEQGTALVGRGQSLGAVLAQLPQTLPQVTQLLAQFGANQHAIADLLQRSNAVVAQVVGQRHYLAAMVNSANSALGALASRRNQLGATVQEAPGALRQAQTTLATLEGTAIPLAPAAEGLRETAPNLVSTLRQIPAFARAAVPTLNEVSEVSPALDKLAANGTPIVSQIVPLTRELVTYSKQGLAPVSNMLANDGGAENLFGEMEGWARSTQGYDASGHIFRFGATVGIQSFDQLLAMLSIPGLPSYTSRNDSLAATEDLLSGLGTAAQKTTGTVGSVLKKTLSGAGTKIAGVLAKVFGGSSGSAPAPAPSKGLQSLLGYLLSP
jgi:virulence factor Mce-like protein